MLIAALVAEQSLSRVPVLFRGHGALLCHARSHASEDTHRQCALQKEAASGYAAAVAAELAAAEVKLQAWERAASEAAAGVSAVVADVGNEPQGDGDSFKLIQAPTLEARQLASATAALQVRVPGPPQKPPMCADCPHDTSSLSILLRRWQLRGGQSTARRSCSLLVTSLCVALPAASDALPERAVRNLQDSWPDAGFALRSLVALAGVHMVAQFAILPPIQICAGCTTQVAAGRNRCCTFAPVSAVSER